LRDIALVADAATPAAEVQGALSRAARDAVGEGFALESVRVFDVYSGQGLPPGKKSLAFNLAFRSAVRTLTDAEVNAAFSKIQSDIAATGKFSVRS
jgi:phenylalanyl-tRNA synthetase beta chain